MNQLSELSCAAFADALAAKTSVPGGGGASALVGALGVALCSMAGRFTAGKKKYEAYEADILRILRNVKPFVSGSWNWWMRMPAGLSLCQKPMPCRRMLLTGMP